MPEKQEFKQKKFYLTVCVMLLRNHLAQISMSGPLFL